MRRFRAWAKQLFSWVLCPIDLYLKGICLFLLGRLGGVTRAFKGVVSGLVDASLGGKSGPGAALTGRESGPGAAPTGGKSLGVVQLAAA